MKPLYILVNIIILVADWMDEVYTAINTLQERVLRAQNNVKDGLADMAKWGNIPLHNRKDNPAKLELLAVNERHPRFVKRYIIFALKVYRAKQIGEKIQCFYVSCLLLSFS